MEIVKLLFSIFYHKNRHVAKADEPRFISLQVIWIQKRECLWIMDNGCTIVLNLKNHDKYLYKYKCSFYVCLGKMYLRFQLTLIISNSYYRDTDACNIFIAYINYLFVSSDYRQ